MADGKVKGMNSGWTPRDSMPPTETPIKDGPLKNEVRKEHPAFAMIGAARFTGGKYTLFGSPIRHNSGVTIRVVEAHEHGDEYVWRQSGERVILELTLSEAQWASFVTAMNVGYGVPCTLSYRQTGDMVRVPLIEDLHPQERKAAGIKAKAEKDLALLLEFTAKFKALCDAPGTPSKTVLRELYSKYLLHAVEYAPGNFEYLAKTVSEHMEHASTAARSEIESYILQAALKFPGLRDAAPEIPQLAPPKESE